MTRMTMDGNSAAAHVSYAFSELAVIYPITPSSPMAELVDEWAVAGKQNLFGEVPKVTQMQSEGGVAGALHGALTCGALATTYTCSQGLLLMLPDMYKIAGELLPTVIHVSARAIATHALSIFGDHQDVMAARATGFAMLASSSVQEVMDIALIAHLASLQASVPFLHFFDGFRTSHEINDIEAIEYEEMRALLDEKDVERFKARALNPDQPLQRGTAQNPDVYFQNREAANGYYLTLPNVVQNVMDRVAVITGRGYHVFDYYGDPNAERVAVLMGSGALTMQETVAKMNGEYERVGVIVVRLYRPFDVKKFLAVLPQSCKRLAVLDRTKEAGSLGEPLYLDVCATLAEGKRTDVEVFGGRYGLGSKEFTPSMCYAVFQNLKSETPKRHFTVGITDDCTKLSLDVKKHYDVSTPDTVACKFYGLGSDGTVGANKNSIQILGNHTNLHVQAYFYYDSKKSGGITVSHLRFGHSPIRSPYLVDRADFIACHNPSYLYRYDMLSDLKDGGTFLLNAPWTDVSTLSEKLPASVKRILVQKRIAFYVIDGTKIADDVGLNGKNSTIMQTAFFLLQPRLLPFEQAKKLLIEQLKKKFAKKGDEVIKQNVASVERVEAALQKIELPDSWTSAEEGDSPTLPNDEYFQKIIHPILTLRGNELPVSAFTPDGSVPTATTKLEKHGTAYLMPEWIPENCIQCNQCAFVCPHACIRPFVLEENTETPSGFTSVKAIGLPNARFRVQVSAHDCMGCGVCANVCPAKNKALVMKPSVERLETEGKNWEFANSLPKFDTSNFKKTTVKGSQFSKPLFEFSYACSGCGETPYVKVLTQLFGERMLIANATGCSSIYGGSSPTCPYCTNENGQGPAWANSLFEDNAEFGYGMRLACDLTPQKERSVWLIGGDGWAYDIGFGGLDHVLASGANVNVLVLDSEVYSNTGGQVSKATPLGAVARFAAAGRRIKKKDLGLMAMSYGYVYVAQVSMGANKQQLLNALTEAESYNGPSLVLAYSPCIAHGVPMSRCMEEEKLAVESGYWNLYRFDPRKEQPFQLDSPSPTKPFRDFLMGENRFAQLKKSQPEIAEKLFLEAEENSKKRRLFYEKLAKGLE